MSESKPTKPNGAGSAKMWGGRFEAAPNASFYDFERSWQFDQRLLPYELALDRAWAGAIAKAGILSESERKQIVAALDDIQARAASDQAWLDSSNAEDVHHFVEMALIEKLGALGAKLHTGRSRNEMVATEFRMFVKEAARDLQRAIAGLIESLLGQAENEFGVPMPGTTHLQHAQPVLLSHWLLGYGEAFLRDAGRLAAAYDAADSSPLASGALAGVAFPMDREALAKELGFSRISANSMDTVSDRDFALEYLFALSVVATHLSRLAEDFILFATPEFGFVTLPDEFSTGSSLMPQKKNPDSWELIRGKTGRITGALVSLLTTLKGIPSTYDRDLQEDKEPVFGAHDQVLAMVRIATGTVAATKFNCARLREAAAEPSLVATEAADYLVARGVPFREAHEIIGRLIRESDVQQKSLRDLSLETLKKFSPAFESDLASALTVEASLSRRNSAGGTAPEIVRGALTAFRQRLGKLTAGLEQSLEAERATVGTAGKLR